MEETKGSPEGKEELDVASPTIVELTARFLDGSELDDVFAAFAMEKAPMMDVEVLRSREFPPEYMVVYQQWMELYENVLTGFLLDQGVSPDELAAALVEEESHGDGASARTAAGLLQATNASVSFEAFMDMLLDAKKALDSGSESLFFERPRVAAAAARKDPRILGRSSEHGRDLPPPPKPIVHVEKPAEPRRMIAGSDFIAAQRALRAAEDSDDDSDDDGFADDEFDFDSEPVRGRSSSSALPIYAAAADPVSVGRLDAAGALESSGSSAIAGMHGSAALFGGGGGDSGGYDDDAADDEYGGVLEHK
eukprot:PLAT1823.4.p1 GENE.PLAT1823.4~~PLAT1823.4.p1  ORF type:complete len:308 (+),score=103.29 PLAT1823.4:22-945(+)